MLACTDFCACAFKWMNSANRMQLPMYQETKGTPVSAWLKLSHDYFIALAAPMVLLVASLPVFAQDQQGQPQPHSSSRNRPSSNNLISKPSHSSKCSSWWRRLHSIPMHLLAQVLTASTYPLEVAMAARWAEKNPDLKGAALEDAMQKEPWDPSVKGLTSVPQVLAMMNDKLDWTQQLGEAFLAQPDDIQNAIQALRARADEAGNLKSSKEQKVRRVAATPSPGYAGPPEYHRHRAGRAGLRLCPGLRSCGRLRCRLLAAGICTILLVSALVDCRSRNRVRARQLFVGPALWYHYNWGYRGYAAIQTNTALYSRFNRVNVTGGGQFQNWKFDAAHRTNVPFHNTNLQQQFGSMSTEKYSGHAHRDGFARNPDRQGHPGDPWRARSAGTADRQGGPGVHGLQTGKNVEGIKTSKAVEGIQTNKNIQNVRTGNRMQGGQQTITHSGNADEQPGPEDAGWQREFPRRQEKHGARDEATTGH